MRRVSKSLLIIELLVVTAFTVTSCVGYAPPVFINQPPVAVIKATPIEGNAPLMVNFDGTDSYDPDGTIVSYLWDFGDGTTCPPDCSASPGTEEQPSHTYTSAGTYSAILTVTDDDGATVTASVQITVELKCHVTHEGDLVIGTDEVFTIVDQNYCQTGNILVEEGAHLILRNARLVFNVAFDAQYNIVVRGNLEADDSAVISDEWFDIIIYPCGKANLNRVFLPEFCQLYLQPHGRATIQSSDLFRLIPEMPANVEVSNSSVREGLVIDLLYVADEVVTVSNIHPGVNDVPVFVGTYSLTLSATSVAGWGIRLPGRARSLQINDSVIDVIRGEYSTIYGTCPVTISNSTMTTLVFEGYDDGEFTMSGASVTEDIYMENSSLTMQGPVILSTIYRVVWTASTVARTYEVVLADLYGVGIPDVTLNLYDPEGSPVWTGTTDQQGKANFEIIFDDSNYNKTWILKAPALGIEKEVRFLTDTPILITA